MVLQSVTMKVFISWKGGGWSITTERRDWSIDIWFGEDVKREVNAVSSRG